jgi:NAD(P) transhydrogenase subunit alpha
VDYTTFWSNIALLVVSGFLGFAVISKVPNTLHTPLMSGTNAIHGIVVVGALLVAGSVHSPDLLTQTIIAFALVFGTVNVIGGFVVTDRMLSMFKKRPVTAARGES